MPVAFGHHRKSPMEQSLVPGFPNRIFDTPQGKFPIAFAHGELAITGGNDDLITSHNRSPFD